MKTRHKKLFLIVGGVAVLTVASLLVLNAFRNNLVFYFTPTQVLAGKAPAHGLFRVGGLVEKGSIHKSGGGLTVDFVITDLKKSIPVHYHGILPDLFRAGQGVVCQGRLNIQGQFIADQVLAKHDATYMPPEVAQELKHAHGPSAPVSSTPYSYKP